MKHAILIMAHNNFSVVSALLEQIDGPEFDIYIHINSNVKSFPKEDWERRVRQSGLYFVPRIRVGYCDYTMVDAVMSLLTTATKKGYDYYHIVSGADLMIKPRQEFLQFFEEHNGLEFVGFSKTFDQDRVRYRHYFTALGRQRSIILSRFFVKLRKTLIGVQKIFHLDHQITDFAEVCKGTDWYSITDSAAKYLIEHEPLFRRSFYRTYCPTEFFPHTVLYNSEFRRAFYQFESADEGLQCLRTIDWERGSPYVFTNADQSFLLRSAGLFARKFDESQDLEIVCFLKNYVKGNSL